MPRVPRKAVRRLQGAPRRAGGVKFRCSPREPVLADVLHGPFRQRVSFHRPQVQQPPFESANTSPRPAFANALDAERELPVAAKLVGKTFLFPPPPSMGRTMDEIAHAGTAGRATAEVGRPLGTKLCNERLTTAGPVFVKITHADRVIQDKPYFKKIVEIALRVTLVYFWDGVSFRGLKVRKQNNKPIKTWYWRDSVG